MVKALSPLKRKSIAPSKSRHTSAEAIKTLQNKTEEYGMTSGEFCVKLPASSIQTARPIRAEADA